MVSFWCACGEQDMSRKAVSMSNTVNPKSAKRLRVVMAKEKRIKGNTEPDTLKPGFKVDKSRAAQAMAKAVSLTHKRLYGETSVNGKICS
jgi:hypothetical protein